MAPIFSQQERELILSALVNDRVGTWGDGRQEKIDALIKKVRQTMSEWCKECGGFVNLGICEKCGEEADNE